MRTALGFYGEAISHMIVSVEPTDNGVYLYHREGAEVRREYEAYQPWLLVPSNEDHFLAGKKHTPLEGESGYNRLIRYPDWSSFHLAARVSDKDANKILYYGSASKNYLMMTGKRLFEGAAFNDVHRLTLDIETTGLDPERHQVFMIALLDNKGYEDALVGAEADVLRKLVTVVKSLDPDVIEGHNLLAFDLPFILRRMEFHGIRPLLGRTNGAAKQGRVRTMMIGPNQKQYQPIYIPGRHVIDTLLQVQKYDSQIMRHMSYGLKEVARVYGIAEEDRIELPRDRILDIYRSNPAVVKTYALQDVRETKRLAELILPVEFMQARAIPDGYQGICGTGNGEKWNSILIAEYLRRGKAIPPRQVPQPYVGGLVECRRTGIIERIVKADVESLYPSLMLSREIRPSSDVENVMLPLLASLKEDRIVAKRKMQGAKDKDEKDYWDGYQMSAKILINSAYGYLGGPFHFADWKAAEQVTQGGRACVAQVAEEIGRRDGSVVEVDTDGVIFVPPSYVADDEESEKAFVSEVGKVLPEGIILAHDGRYRGMLSLAMKNYVLLDYEGKMTFKGASLKNRAAEKYGKVFLEEAIGRLFNGDTAGVVERYRALLVDLYNRKVPPEDLVRRERITEKTHSSKAKKRLSAAASELDVGDYIYVYEREDGSLAPLEDYQGDENVLYYMDRLWSVFKRVEDLFGGEVEFKRQFPKPGKRNYRSLVGDNTVLPKPVRSPSKRVGSDIKVRVVGATRKTERRPVWAW